MILFGSNTGSNLYSKCSIGEILKSSGKNIVPSLAFLVPTMPEWSFLHDSPWPPLMGMEPTLSIWEALGSCARRGTQPRRVGWGWGQETTSSFSPFGVDE